MVPHFHRISLQPSDKDAHWLISKQPGQTGRTAVGGRAKVLMRENVSTHPCMQSPTLVIISMLDSEPFCDLLGLNLAKAGADAVIGISYSK